MMSLQIHGRQMLAGTRCLSAPLSAVGLLLMPAGEGKGRVYLTLKIIT